MGRIEEIRARALHELQQHQVLMLNGHFDYGNGYHGRVYVNPHQLFRYPSRIWRFAQDLLDVLPGAILEATDLVAGPVTGGALLAHTMAGLLDSRRPISSPPTLVAPFAAEPDGGPTLSRFYPRQIADARALPLDDVRNTGQTLLQCAGLVRESGGTLIATAEICDRMEAVVDAGVPNFPLVEYNAPENYPSATCPLCAGGIPINTF